VYILLKCLVNIKMEEKSPWVQNIHLAKTQGQNDAHLTLSDQNARPNQIQDKGTRFNKETYT
jgi:hypothetical protein